MQRTNIYLEDRQTAALDRLAGAEGVSRAEIIRRLIDQGIDGASSDLTVDFAWFDESFGAAVEFDVPRRSGTDRDVHLRRMADA
ncbi:MAG: CopG family transcriptional regulator [Aeromicrobium sp.]|uniref:ribbon-helix-helix domain-containing protein n=1 Tax=Aeromicrobium sp. TaxID=1871063 RepID=UPI0039E6A8B9